MSNNSEHIEEHETHNGYGNYFVIWLSLIALTALTVGVAGLDLGIYTIVVALLIASVKAMTVINVFMHVKYDDALMKGVIAACGLLVLSIFILLGTDLLV